MKQQKLNRSLTFFLVLMLLLAQLSTTALAAPPAQPAAGTATVSFTAPQGANWALTDVTVSLHKPTVTDYNKNTPCTDKTKLSPVGGVYTLTEPGTYCYDVHGKGFYSIYKMFNVTAADLAAGKALVLPLATGRISGKGFEPCDPNLPNTPKDFDTNNGVGPLTIWPDEILAHFGTGDLKNYTPYTTPAFTKKYGLHEFTSHADMLEFITQLDAGSSKMHVYIMGKTPVYQYAMPLVLFTNSAIPEGATVEQAAAIVRANGKPTVWHQAQIHPNEPASGEGALVMMQEMTGSYGEALLSSINVVIVPRINPDGSYLYRRTTYQGFDMNRDHMALKAPELAMLHTNYMLFMPELCVDGHEFGYTGVDASGPFMRNADDMQSTPASSLNNDPKLNAMSLAAVDKLHLDAADNGLRIYHYGTTVNNPIGRAYYGLFNSVSVLVETRGIGGGKSNFPRRVYSQVSAAKSLYEYAAANAASLRSVVATGRQQVIEHGKTYDETDLLALYQTASGKTMSPRKLTRTQYNLDGTVHKTSSAALKMNDTIAQSRVRPTAYLLSKSAGDLLNLDRTLYILDNQGAEYYEIAPGATVNLQQYYNTGIWKDEKGKDTNTPKVELRAPADITFPRGAVVVPMDQVAGNVIAMLMEPDVRDSSGYDGTLAQFGVLKFDAATSNYPLYRFIGNNPRTALPPKVKASAATAKAAPHPAAVLADQLMAAEPKSVVRVFGAPMILAGTETAAKLASSCKEKGYAMETVELDGKRIVSPIVVLDRAKSERISWTAVNAFATQSLLVKLIDGATVHYAPANLIAATPSNRIFYSFDEFTRLFAK